MFNKFVKDKKNNEDPLEKLKINIKKNMNLKDIKKFNGKLEIEIKNKKGK